MSEHLPLPKAEDLCEQFHEGARKGRGKRVGTHCFHWAAARAGFDPGDKSWIKLSKHFRGVQNGDGGWGFITDASRPTMATAGLASLFLVFDIYHGKTPFSRKNPQTFTECDAAEVLKAIERGMDWLGKSKENRADGYYRYGVERAGVVSGHQGRKRIQGRKRVQDRSAPR